jgi:hypothetical protein
MAIDHDLQIFRPWFYQSYLIDEDITVHVARGKKVAIYRFDFRELYQKNVLVNEQENEKHEPHD